MATPPAKKVLVVEDNELNMKLFCDLLDAFGFQTVESRDGLKAVDLARQHKPDLIIMDIQLPEVSGLDLTRWIKDDTTIKDIPIMAAAVLHAVAVLARGAAPMRTALLAHKELVPAIVKCIR